MKNQLETISIRKFIAGDFDHRFHSSQLPFRDFYKKLFDLHLYYSHLPARKMTMSAHPCGEADWFLIDRYLNIPLVLLNEQIDMAPAFQYIAEHGIETELMIDDTCYPFVPDSMAQPFDNARFPKVHGFDYIECLGLPYLESLNSKRRYAVRKNLELMEDDVPVQIATGIPPRTSDCLWLFNRFRETSRKLERSSRAQIADYIPLALDQIDCLRVGSGRYRFGDNRLASILINTSPTHNAIWNAIVTHSNSRFANTYGFANDFVNDHMKAGDILHFGPTESFDPETTKVYSYKKTIANRVAHPMVFAAQTREGVEHLFPPYFVVDEQQWVDHKEDTNVEPN